MLIRHILHRGHLLVGQYEDLAGGWLISLNIKLPLSRLFSFEDRSTLITAGSIRVDILRYIFMSLLRLCIEGNVIEFNGKYYRQRFGISIASPLSPVLAGLYMEFFETELVRRSSISPPLWLRYVDDVLVSFARR